ncbi:Ltp family lipoprotein [Arthrobacter sunyaminii]|uniref:Ltp family lipoprotein n=1 Tax=Arthrobacter sunyaminii TaxID=2816859 RepID=UPI0027DBCA40|nr:Ltp family lipoprotein [Arthrobacter sunyaminii]
MLGIGLLTPAVVANVPTGAAPTETVSTAPASPTEAPAETPAKVPHGHRAAAEKAESLLDIFHYSDAELRDELDDRGFTPEEIDYAISQLD